ADPAGGGETAGEFRAQEPADAPCARISARRRPVHFRWRDMAAAAGAGGRYRAYEPRGGLRPEPGGDRGRPGRALGAPVRRRAGSVPTHRVPACGPITEKAAAELVGRWSRMPAGATLNALPAMAGLTAEITARSVFGNQLGEDSANAVTDSFTSYPSLIDSIN